MGTSVAAETVIALRTDAGWDRAELAARSGLDIKLIAGVESGHSELPLSALARLARAFGVSVAALRPAPGGGMVPAAQPAAVVPIRRSPRLQR